MCPTLERLHRQAELVPTAATMIPSTMKEAEAVHLQRQETARHPCEQRKYHQPQIPEVKQVGKS